MPKCILRRTALAAAIVSLGFALPAMAQTGSMSKAASLSSADKSFMQKAAQGGMAEVQLGQLATQKASSDQVKQFGQRMVGDHTKANDQLKQIASSKGATLPTELSSNDKREMDRLSKLSGAKFDKAYMDLMVSDHKKDVSEFKSEASKAHDPDVKDFASSTLPTLEEHLQLAQSADQAAKHETTSSAASPSGPGATASSTGDSSHASGGSNSALSAGMGASSHAATSKGGS